MTACKHTYRPDPVHPDFETCCACNTSHSTVAPPPEEVYDATYWTEARGHSTLRDQVYNVESHLENGVSKNDFILKLIDVEDRSAALEIGCAPGSLLGRLMRDAKFDDVMGIEGISNKAVLNEIRNIAIENGGWPYQVYGGFFPCKDLTFEFGGSFSLIVGCDVFEHSHEPEAFLAECARLLKPGGQLILMLPLITDSTEMPERMWNSEEHVWLHSQANLIAMLRDAQFTAMHYSSWCPGHEVVSANRGDC